QTTDLVPVEDEALCDDRQVLGHRGPERLRIRACRAANQPTKLPRFPGASVDDHGRPAPAEPAVEPPKLRAAGRDGAACIRPAVRGPAPQPALLPGPASCGHSKPPWTARAASSSRRP